MKKNYQEIEIPEELQNSIKRFRKKPGALLMILHAVQRYYRHIPRLVAIKIAEELGIPVARVYGVITFYSMFKLEEPGKYHICVCHGTACHLGGGSDIIEAIEKLLGIGINGITDDKEFSLELIPCLGCCGQAPAITVNGKMYAKVTEKEVEKIISSCRGSDGSK